MIGYIYDDGGRKDAGYKGTTGDCVVRAAAIISATDYREMYGMMADANANSAQRAKRQGVKRGYAKRTAANGVAKDAYVKVFGQIGLVKVRLPKGQRPTYTEAYERYGDCVVTTARHMCAIVGGNLRDLFDGRTYEMESEYGEVEVRERKAQSVWVMSDRLTKRQRLDWIIGDR